MKQCRGTTRDGQRCTRGACGHRLQWCWQHHPSMQVAHAAPVHAGTACGARTKRSGEPCGHRAGWGTDHPGFGRCKLHGGCSPSGRAAAQRQMAAAAVQRFALAVDVDPHEALLQDIQRTAGIVAYCERQIDFEEPDSIVFGIAREVERSDADGGYSQVERQGQIIAEVIRGALVDLGVADHPDVAAAVGRRLRLIDGGAA